MRKVMWGALALAVLLAAMGPSPRYLEELAIGGGYGSAPDGGLDVAADGDLRSNGSASIGGNLAVMGDAGVGLAPTSGARLHIRTANDGSFSPALLLHNASDVLGTSAGLLFQAESSDANRAKGGLAYEVTGAFGRGDLHFLNSSYAGPGDANPASDVRMTLTNEGRLLLTRFLGTQTDHDLVSLLSNQMTVNGDLDATGGDIDAGADGFVRGTLTAWEGPGGAPGTVRLHSPDGSPWYLFVEDDGTLRVHDAPPASNTDGSIVGLQD